MSRELARRRAAALRALLAAALLTTALAAVGAGPAQAANTAAEFLIDSDDDELPDARSFAGRDRYETAVKLAERYAQERGGLNSVSTVIVVSGTSGTDGAVVAGLAG
ncbi:cell wall-binding repeat-containing protein [Candidatus Poriferisodalis sp.]|uniref:cell wall-binding repeat-containing protein n=1 Tax=Candidatus Poriferisodalis sp. TaxID=3101277 RepID=UPI003C6F1457